MSKTMGSATVVANSVAAAAKAPPKQSKPMKKAATPSAKGGAGDSGAASSNPSGATADAFEGADKSKWKITECQFQGVAKMESVGQKETIKGSIQEGKKKFLANPEKYLAMTFQSSMLTNPAWTPDQQKYTFIHRKGTVGYRPQGVDPSGWMTLILQEYQRLPPFCNDELPAENRDKYTDTVLAQWNGKKLKKPFLPGRGMGIVDAPNLKIIGDVDPSDIHQVRYCWFGAYRIIFIHTFNNKMTTLL